MRALLLAALLIAVGCNAPSAPSSTLRPPPTAAQVEAAQRAQAQAERDRVAREMLSHVQGAGERAGRGSFQTIERDRQADLDRCAAVANDILAKQDNRGSVPTTEANEAAECLRRWRAGTLTGKPNLYQ
ncbi:MAG TPA: hypothetical protein VKM54_21985 [Myxococcota bacterium]|nr:hypothetical protein [Myxococcota bacterium]